MSVSFAACKFDGLVEMANNFSKNGFSKAAIAAAAGASSSLDHGDDDDDFTVVGGTEAEPEREGIESWGSEDGDGGLAIKQRTEQETGARGLLKGDDDDYQSITEWRPPLKMSITELRSAMSPSPTMYSSGSRDSNLGGAAGGEEGQWSPIRDSQAAAAPEQWSPIREPVSVSVPVAVPVPDDEDATSCDMELDDDVFGGEVVQGLESSIAAAAAAGGAVPVPVSSSGATSREEEDAALEQRREVVRRGGGGGAVQSVGAGFEVTADDEPPLKRKRLPDLGRDAAIVQVTYENLTRESRNFLQAALQNWSYWHSRNYSCSSPEPMAPGVLGGTEVYSPVLTMEPTNNADSVSVWMDRPSKLQQEVSLQETQDSRITLESREKEKDVPLYDRGYLSVLSSEGSADRGLRYAGGDPEDVTRCFNCGSYSHSLKDCSRPHSAANIKCARDKLLNRRGTSSLSRTPSRYYESSPGGKYDDIRPGVLRTEARKALGIEELDPPPWLNRMRELGYPPGYLEYEDNYISGLEIFGDDIEISSTGQESAEGGGGPIEESVTPTIVREVLTRPKEIAKFPGINAPIPENADEKLWEPRLETQLEQHPPSRGVKRAFRQMSQGYEGVMDADVPPGVSPKSFPSSWRVDVNSDAAAPDFMTDRNPVRVSSSVASADHSTYHLLNNRSGWNVHMDGGGSLNPSPSHSPSPSPTFPASEFPLLSVDPAAYWLKRRVAEAAAGAGSFAPGSASLDRTSGRSSVSGPSPPQHHQHRHRHSHPHPLSPARGLSWQTKSTSYLSPGFGGLAKLTTPHHLYPGHDQYNRQFQTPSSTLRMANKVSHNDNEAWHKAQAALSALKPKPGQTSEGLLSPKPHRSEGSLSSPYRHEGTLGRQASRR